MEDRFWHKAYANGVPPFIDYEAITLSQALERTAQRHPDTIALVMMGKTITYRQLNDLVNRFSGALSDLGIQKGDKVALILPNMPQAIIASYAVFRLGAVVVMNNPLYTETELAHQLNDSDSKTAIGMDLLVPRLLTVKEKTGIETIISCHIRDYLPFPKKQLFPLVKKKMHRKVMPHEDVLEFMDLIRRYPPAPPGTEVRFDDLAALLYTGGTTGLSKGVMLSHANCSICVQQLKAWLPDAEEGKDSMLGTFPVFHTAGFTTGMNTAIYRGLTYILIPRPEPGVVLEMTRKYHPNWFPCVPTLFVGILAHPDFPKTDFSSVKGCVSGAAPLALETIKAWKGAVGADIVECYGLTETSTLSHANPWGGTTKPGSVGIPVSDTDCRIVDVETGTRDMPLGESGEVILKGPQVTSGYYQQPEETAEALRDGWLYTGDIGYMDDEGYLFIVDRKKDMIIAGGYNIYPRDIDEVLYGHPKIKEGCAVGVPDPYRGETVKAFIVPEAGQQVTEDEVRAWCREKLAAYKVPKQVEVMDELPKSPIGKVLRRRLREMEMAKQAAGADQTGQ
ncbi:MAG: long-chain fatty acid--CoA ligase [Deltaproteobacteria bacterium]|nr:long-chain fatty acid--CoA ligase [Deltaproteobacteria bacterium]MCF8119247.1 long-chain fatty acid--CoA ligase [Deltaproteobacteria bacterium]